MTIHSPIVPIYPFKFLLTQKIHILEIRYFIGRDTDFHRIKNTRTGIRSILVVDQLRKKGIISLNEFITMQYFVEPTRNTPFVNLDVQKGIIEFKGVSSPENSLAFYQPVFEMLPKYRQASSGNVEVNMAFVHFNTSTSKCLFDIFKEIKQIEKNGVNVNVNWFYDEFDEDMKEVGEDYSDILDIPFTYHVMEEE